MQKVTTMNYFVYMMTNVNNRVLYIGVTSDLPKRVYEHKHHLDKSGFTSQYNVEKLVYYECTQDINAAIAREKQLKGWTRSKKNFLVAQLNPEWKDLYTSIL